jgi:hypothetical protein
VCSLKSLSGLINFNVIAIQRKLKLDPELPQTIRFGIVLR